MFICTVLNTKYVCKYVQYHGIRSAFFLNKPKRTHSRVICMSLLQPSITPALLWSVGGTEASHYCCFKATSWLSLHSSPNLSLTAFVALSSPPFSLSLSLSLSVFVYKIWKVPFCDTYIWSVTVSWWKGRRLQAAWIKKYERRHIVLPRRCLPALIVSCVPEAMGPRDPLPY